MEVQVEDVATRLGSKENPSTLCIGSVERMADPSETEAASDKSSAKGDESFDSSTKEQNESDGSLAAETSLTKLLCLAKPEWPMLFLAFLIMTGSEAVGLYNPLLVADAYDFLVNPTLTPSERMDEINSTMALVLILMGASVVGGFVRGAIMQSAGERIVARLRNQLYACILRQEIAFFDQTKTGELVSRLGSDTTLLQQGTSTALPEVILNLVKLLVSVGLMFWISSTLAAVTLAAVFVIFCISVPFGRWIGALSKRYQDKLGQAQTHSTEALGGMRTVQAFAAEVREQERYRHDIGEPKNYRFWYPTDHRAHPTTYSIGFFKGCANTAFYSVVFGCGFGSIYLSLWYGFKLVTDGQISLGDLTAFQSYVFQIGGSLGQASRHISEILAALGASGRIFYLLEREPEIPKKSTTGKDDNDKSKDEEWAKPPKVPAQMEGAVDFNNVHFSYPSRPEVPVLKNFSLSIPANTTAALVGSSGAGKSTVVSLLQRFYDVSSGSITIDGNDIRDLDLKWLRSNMGYVQQEPQLFGLTIRQNVTYGVDRQITDQELEEVCEKANAREFIVKWPKGYDTMVGERGVKLSGGQKQRLAIARALLVDPRILLLDEATSALDAESEHLVQEAINKAVVGRTVLIVAHRLSTIQRASQIVVIDDHEIVDVGTHSSLLERCNKYQDLIKRQSIIGKLPADALHNLQK